ncbi:hypothetical protein AKJ09_02611 [Labilithrix luteola]|uniref:Uncharacterized protein n=1 Tax=Labilithrix luteola TaxID=1391654 RepID=A0A0K1PQZ5_9BACT|nr:hypothetical protein [Labilithrix luteola]AKU95947.1 hypothetical protein AKJ09_02611 [Labilithrix luteola]
MDANRNLTTQVRDYKDRWLSAETEVRTAEARMAEASRGLPFGVAVDRGEWSRMGREGTLRLRVPCATWHAGPRLEIRGRTRGKASSRGPHDVALHAEIVGLSKEEIGTVEEAYERTHTRLWSKVRAVCEVTEEFQGSAEESPPETDHDRVELCRRAAILVASPATQRAVDDVTALLGAGGSSERARGLEERVLFTLAESPKDLFEEVVGVLGRERAVRAFEYGAMCLDEIVYVVRSGGA